MEALCGRETLCLGPVYRIRTLRPPVPKHWYRTSTLCKAKRSSKKTGQSKDKNPDEAPDAAGVSITPETGSSPGPSVFDSVTGDGDAQQAYDEVVQRYKDIDVKLPALDGYVPTGDDDVDPLSSYTVFGSYEGEVVDGLNDVAERYKATVAGTSLASVTVSMEEDMLDEEEEVLQQKSEDFVENAAAEAKDRIDQAGQALQEVQQGTAAVIKDVQKDADGAFEEAEKQLNTVVENAAETGAAFLDSAQKGFETSAAQIEQGLDELTKRYEEGVESLAKTAEGMVDRLESAYASSSAAADAALENLPPEVGSAVRQVRSGIERTTSDIRERFDSFRDDFNAGGPSAPFATVPLTALPLEPPSRTDEVEYAKRRLVYSVAGLDRGFAASAVAGDSVEAAVRRLLVAAGSRPELSWVAEEGQNSTLQVLDGRWRLLYSSGFASGSLGGRNPGPPAALLPVTVGQVYQVISAYTSRLDNVVEFYFRYGLPELPGLGIRQDPVVATLCLKHSFEAVGGPTVRITFEDTEVTATGGLNGVLGRLPALSLSLPEFLQPPRGLRSSTFDVLYLDDDLRITRGDRGELRVFTRV